MRQGNKAFDAGVPNHFGLVQGITTQLAHTTWYRGEHCAFSATKEDLAQPGAIEQHVGSGWFPPNPFIEKSHGITAFGSCFAQHISDHLAARSYNLLTNKEQLSLDSYVIRCAEGMINTFAIRQQFEWAFLGSCFSEDLWFDSKTSGNVFWRAIPITRFDPEQHGFRLTSVAENLDNLDAIRTIIREHRPDATIILTLSPIPLHATFRPVSCMTANSVSKATLRVAIDEMMRRYPDDRKLFYFPAYEMVKEFFVDPYLDDNRHVRPEILNAVMETFERAFCVPE
jgi:hypothetical protein